MKKVNGNAKANDNDNATVSTSTTTASATPQISGKRPSKSDTILSKPDTTSPAIRYTTPKSSMATKPTSSIYQKRINVPDKRETPKTKSATDGLSVREKLRRMANEPPQKLNVVKRDLRGVNEIQREIRHRKGIFSDDEDKKDDPRLLNAKKRQPVVTERTKLATERPGRIGGKTVPSSSSIARHNINGNESMRLERVGGKTIPKSIPQQHAAPLRAPIDPMLRRQRLGGKRPPGAAAAATERPIRMPFMRPRAPPARSHFRYEEEEDDEDMQSFIVDDEEEEEENDYSAEIGRIFRYDRKRYRDEAFSDDDMEADAREVLREEKRSARLGRKEDLEEEKREMERIKRLKTKGKAKA